MTYEVIPVRYDGDNVEQCEPEKADAWGVYRRADNPDGHGHYLAEWVEDHPTQPEAEAAAERLRREHAGFDTPAPRYRCTACKGTNVLFDAWVSCNDPEDVRTFDDTFCEDCDGECRIEEVPPEEVPQ